MVTPKPLARLHTDVFGGYPSLILSYSELKSIIKMTAINPTKPGRNKGGRPPKTIKRNRTIGLKCTPPEERIIRGKAKKAMLSVSEYPREMAINGTIMMRGRPLPKEILSFTATLNHLAANLNHIARQRNKFEELTIAERTMLMIQSKEFNTISESIKSYLR